MSTRTAARRPLALSLHTGRAGRATRRLAILALSAPHVLWIAGEGDKVPDLVAAAYASAGKPDAVRLVAKKKGD